MAAGGESPGIDFLLLGVVEVLNKGNRKPVTAQHHAVYDGFIGRRRRL